MTGGGGEVPKAVSTTYKWHQRKKKSRVELPMLFFSRMQKLSVNGLASGQYAPRFD